MVKPILVANTLAITVFIVRLVIAIKAFIFPGLFAWEYKAMTMGQNTSFINPTGQEVVITTIVPAIGAWVVGFLWASVYNYLAKRK